jgi:hypothetical protein
VGHRDADSANVFIGDLASRIKGRTQLNSDGNKAYLRAFEDAFGVAVDYAMLVKLYGSLSTADCESAVTPLVITVVLLWFDQGRGMR